MIYVEVYVAPGCKYCPKAVEIVEEAVNELRSQGYMVDVKVKNVYENWESFSMYGKDAVPLIAVDGRLVAVGIPPLLKRKIVKTVKQIR